MVKIPEPSDISFGNFFFGRKMSEEKKEKQKQLVQNLNILHTSSLQGEVEEGG